MIRATLMTLALVAATSAGHALAAPGREVISIDDGPGRDLYVVCGADGPSDWPSERREVLDYTDAAGVPVRVYADHRVTRGEIEERLRQAEQEGQGARTQGRREADQARIEAAQERIEARREAQEARYEAAQARAEALDDAY